MPGNPDWGGTALVHGIDILADGFGVTMAGGQTISFPPFEINRPGYLMNVGSYYPGANGTAGLVVMDVSWFDSGQNVHFGHETWEMAVGTDGNGFYHTGRGPTKGQLLGLAFTNVDPTQQLQSTFWFAQTTQHAARDDIRVHLDGISPVWNTVPGDSATENELANILNLAIPNGTTGPYLLPLYSGQASIYWSCTGQSAANDVSVEVYAASGSGTQADIYKLIAGATPFASTPGQLITLPRRCCLLKIVNTGAATATLSLIMIAQEYSS